ncbi:MAG: hypothetical protein ACLPYS_15220 [Vulcanimicrobiaceae bacterium]
MTGRRWHWQRPELIELAYTLADLGFEMREPPIVAEWTARGLPAYDASYVALAEADAAKHVTEDQSLLAIAGEHVSPLAAIEA